MKTKDIPEAEATKLRLIRELPFVLQVPIDRIITAARDWEDALYGINKYLSDILAGIKKIRSVRYRFNLIGPIGETRKKVRQKKSTT